MSDTSAGPASCALAIVGAGPAGMTAAITAAALGIDALVVDEQPAPGGQIYRATTRSPLQPGTILGDDYWSGRALADAFAASGAGYLPGTTVWSVAAADDGDGFEIGVSHEGAARLVRARHVIVATGALERPFPVPGWTLPGVLTAGAAQIALKSSGLVPEGRVALAGTGPLLWLLAAQLLRAGAPPTAILDTTPAGDFDAWRHAPAFLLSPYAGKGLSLIREVRASVPVISGVAGLRAEGDGRLHAVAFAAGGRERRMEVDALLLHQGVAPNINLALATRCRHRWDDAQLAFVPEIDAWGASSVAGIAIAGDGAGIGGAEAAAERGRLAALDAAARLGAIGEVERDRRAVAPRRALARALRGRAFLDRRFRPALADRVPSGDTIVCRCEEVTAAQIVEAVGIGATGPNQLKAYLRCGMGPCQGRLCGLTVTELIAEARGQSRDAIGHYRLRAPVKPLTLAELASMPATDADTRAVVRG